MANLSNINNILRISSSGVGLNKDNTGPSELDIESAGADMIDMTRTGQKTYRFAISGASAFSLFDVAANADRLLIDSSGNSTFSGTITSGNITINGSSRALVVSSSNDQVVSSFVCDNNAISTIGFKGNTGVNDYNVRIGADGSSLVAYTVNIVRMTINSSGNTTFAGRLRANNWFQGSDGTNTLFSNLGAGLILQTAGADLANNNSKIFFRNVNTTVSHTFDTNNGDAAFSGNAELKGNLIINKFSNTAPYADGEIRFTGRYDRYVGGIKTFTDNASYPEYANGLDFFVQRHVYALPNGHLAMRIDSEGNVGIGTATPPVKLSINGWSYNPGAAANAGCVGLKQSNASAYGYVVEASANDKWMMMGHNGTNGIIETTYAASGGHSNLEIKTGSSNHLILQSSGGFVGIGETNPGTKLTIKHTDDTFNDLDLLQLKRVWSTASGNDRSHGISFSDTNATLAKIYANRYNSGSNYGGKLEFYVNLGTSGTSFYEAVSISNTATLQVNPQTSSYGIRQNGVSNISNSGYVAGNGTLLFTYDATSQGSMFIECVFNHYGYISSYGCSRIATVAIGPNIQIQNIQDITSPNGGAWTFNRVSNSQFTVAKTAGTYAGGGYYFINIRGNGVKYT